MQRLKVFNPLFDHVMPPAIPHDPMCGKCSLGVGPARCVSPEYLEAKVATASDQILYVLADNPLQAEMRVRPYPRPLVSPAGQNLRQYVRENWDGAIVFDYALRCPTPREFEVKVNSKGNMVTPELNACAGYTSKGLEQARQRGNVDRVFAVGQYAVAQLLGIKVNMRSTFGGYGFMREAGDRSTPVFWAMNPMEFPTRINTFYQRLFEQHVHDACTAVIGPGMGDPKGLVTNVMVTAEDAAEFLRWARSHRGGWLSYDTEGSGVTHGMHHPHFGILCLSFANAKGESYVADAAELYKPGPIREAVISVLTDPYIGKNGQNIKFDNRAVYFALGVEVAGPQFDVRLASKLDDAEALTALDTTSAKVGMGGLKREHTEAMASDTAEARRVVKQRAKAAGIPVEAYISRTVAVLGTPAAPNLALASLEVVQAKVASIPGKQAKNTSYALTPQRLSWRYNAGDSISTERLRVYFMAKWDRDNTQRGRAAKRTMNTLLMPASMAFERIERRGFLVHKDNVRTMNAYLDQQQRELWDAMRPMVPSGYNPNSDKERREFLFDTLGLEPVTVSRETEDASTSDAVLAELEYKHPAVPVIPLLRRWNKLGTMRERYGDGRTIFEDGPVKGLVQHICPACGRVHASYNLDIARTGRLSCSDPALHGWTSPSRDDPDKGLVYGRMCRDEFTARPGYCIVQFDYKQLEYVIAAMLFDEPVMQAYCAQGIDPHMAAAKVIAHLFGVPPGKWDLVPDKEKKRIRSFAKTIVFAQLYGQGIKALAVRLSCSVQFAKEVANALFGSFPTLMANINKLKQKVRFEGGVWSWWDGSFARWRPLYEAGFNQSDKYSEGKRGEADRAGVNTPVQGTAAEYGTASVVACENGYAENGIDAAVVAAVHDSVVAESKIEHVDSCVDFTKYVMEGWPSYSPSGRHVQLRVDVEIGFTWGSLKSYVPGKVLETLMS